MAHRFLTVFVLVSVFFSYFFVVVEPAHPATDFSQFVLTVKNPAVAVGKNFDFTSKYCGFFTTSTNQHWIYTGVSRDFVNISAGMVAGWNDRGRVFSCVKVNPDVGKFTPCVDFTAIEGRSPFDIYSWIGVDYNFCLGGEDAYIGPHVEFIRSANLTKAQGGIHAGVVEFELGYYKGEAGWSIRGCYTLKILSD